MTALVEQRRFSAIGLEISDEVATIRFDRPQANNSIDQMLLTELHQVLDELAGSSVRVIVLRGDERAFCTGMDFGAFTDGMAGADTDDQDAQTRSAAMTRSYMDLLKKLSLHRCIVISLIEGRALAGGVGIVAASDYAIAGEGSTFALPEVIWGLLPSMVIPYLIRRVGHQKALQMTMLGRTLDARQAAAVGLVDQAEAPQDLERALGMILRQISRMHAPVAPLMKQYFRDLSAITDEVEDRAVRTTTELSRDELVKANIANFTRYGRFPWSAR